MKQHSLLVALALTASTNSSVSFAGTLTEHRAQINRVVTHSRVLFTCGWNGESQSDDADPQKVASAHRWLGAMSPHHRRHTLSAAVADTPQRHDNSRPLAYVAGMHGIEPELNVKRVVWDQRSPAIGRRGARFGYGGFEFMYCRVYDIYLRFPSAKSRRFILGLRSDAAGSMFMDGVRHDLIKREPGAVLEVAAKDANVLQRLRSSLSPEASEEIKRVFQRYRHHRAREIRRVAWLCLRTLSDRDIRRARYGRAVAGHGRVSGTSYPARRIYISI